MGSWVEAGEGRVSGTCPPTFPKQWVRRAQTLRQACWEESWLCPLGEHLTSLCLGFFI